MPLASPYQDSSYLGLRYPPPLQDDLVLHLQGLCFQEGPILRYWGLGPRGIFLGDTVPPTPEATPPRDAQSGPRLSSCKTEAGIIPLALPVSPGPFEDPAPPLTAPPLIFSTSKAACGQALR